MNDLYINQHICQYADQTGRIPWNKGKSWSNEVKQKMKIARAKRVTTNETRLKMSLAHKGKPKSAEWKEKIRLSNQVAWEKKKNACAKSRTTHY
jgi:NUMOD3 motif-containing protein